MSDLVGNPEDRFSRVEAHISLDRQQYQNIKLDDRNDRQKINSLAAKLLLQQTKTKYQSTEKFT